MSYQFRRGDSVNLNKRLFRTVAGPTPSGKVALEPIRMKSGSEGHGYAKVGHIRWFNLSTVEREAIGYETLGSADST